MDKVTPYDFGGRELLVTEVVTDELLGTIQGLNRDLGTPNDPYYNEYRDFLEEVHDADLVLIDSSILTKNTYEDMDLSGISSNVKPFTGLFMLVKDSLDILFKCPIKESCAERAKYGDDEYFFSNEWFKLTDGDVPKSAV